MRSAAIIIPVILLNIVAACQKVAQHKAHFRDCTTCPEMIVIPAGHFLMGSPFHEKSWAANHGSSFASVADEAPQHDVAVPSFALGKYDVTRAEVSTFARETHRPQGSGCAKDSFKWYQQPELNWENPGFHQTAKDPVVCVSWQDAQD